MHYAHQPGKTTLLMVMKLLEKKKNRDFGGALMGCPTPPAVFTRHCSFRLPHVPFDDTWPGRAALYFLRRGEKLGRYLDRLKRRGIFFDTEYVCCLKDGKKS
ncbi:hypothetical protein LAZ67_21000720 [Cordylochernes scorpioides]|uniref:Uncharacterized protein n=1 Tax=Cordylochernes scorpioides TaxID=51811 RepID=A0ABY6LQE5_9ARAC|nr:hypothetical protein LAZ67_21000720 [Cordylochernes scorpioides]